MFIKASTRSTAVVRKLEPANSRSKARRRVPLWLNTSAHCCKPREIVNFAIEKAEPEWKKEWRDHLLQYNLWERDEKGQGKPRKVPPKLPFKYSYVFLSDGDARPRKLMIEDWEIRGLYWNCLHRSGGDTDEANRQVRKKYFEEFLAKNDLYLFLGTTLQYQLVSPQPFIIVGVFYPPKPKTDLVQLRLTEQ